MSLKLFKIFYLFMILTAVSHAHQGGHGSAGCTVMLGDIELRINGYQFQGNQSNRHYCRHFPYLGQTILKIDSVTADLNDMSLELQLLKRNSWLGWLLNKGDAFSVIKQQPLQYFSKQVVSIEEDIQSRDIYILKMRLQQADGKIIEQQFMFLLGFPIVLILVGLSCAILLVMVVVFLKQLSKH